MNVSIQEAIETVNRAINNTLREIMDPNRRRTPSDLLTLFRWVSLETIHRVSVAAKISNEKCCAGGDALRVHTSPLL